MFKMAIIDDSASDAEEISRHLKKSFLDSGKDIQTFSFTEAEIFLEALNEQRFDAVFLDIVMPGKNGFEIARQIRDSKSEVYIIFVTNYNDLVYESFDFQPFQFITKEDLYSDSYLLKKTVTRLIDHKKKDEVFKLFDDKKGYYEVTAREIYYIENDKHYLNYHTSISDGPLRERESISERAEFLSKLDIIRIHRKYLVNVSYIKILDNQYDQVILKDGTKLPISRTYKKEAEEAYKLYLRTTV